MRFQPSKGVTGTLLVSLLTSFAPLYAGVSGVGGGGVGSGIIGSGGGGGSGGAVADSIVSPPPSAPSPGPATEADLATLPQFRLDAPGDLFPEGGRPELRNAGDGKAEARPEGTAAKEHHEKKGRMLARNLERSVQTSLIPAPTRLKNPSAEAAAPADQPDKVPTKGSGK